MQRTLLQAVGIQAYSVKAHMCGLRTLHSHHHQLTPTLAIRRFQQLHFPRRILCGGNLLEISNLTVPILLQQAHPYNKIQFTNMLRRLQ